MTQSVHGVAMAYKSRAEISLLDALSRSKARSPSSYLKQQQELAQDESERPDSDNLPQFDLKSAVMPSATDDEVLIGQVRTLEDDVLGVRQLENQRLSEGDKLEEPSQIQLNAVRRRDRHMQALVMYEKAVNEISEGVEVALIAASDHVKDSLQAIDDRLQQRQNHFKQDEVLLAADKHLVLAEWTENEQITQQRTQELARFARELDGIENSRVGRVREQLQQLTVELMETAYALPPEVERVIEAQAFEANAVVISNRKVYADLVARMSTVNVDVFVDSRLAWEAAQSHWRRLRHDHAIQEFRSTLESPAFTDPDDRQRILAEIRSHQQSVHDERRLLALKQLEEGGAALTSQRLQQILTDLAATQQEDDEANQVFFSRLRASHESHAATAEALQEALRLELHGFGALAREGDIEAAKTELEKLLDNDTLEDFFRSSGGLRAELDSIAKRLVLSDLIYNSNVAALLENVQLLLSALPLAQLMESQGKEAERKAVQATLEKIRKATKHDIAALLPPLQTQLQVLVHLDGMDDVFKAELEDLANQLSAIATQSGATMQATSALSKGGQDANTIAPSPPTEVTATFIRQQSTLSSSSKTTAISPPGRTSLTSPRQEPSIDLQAVRRVQRRLATLVFASELPSPIQQHLQFIADQLVLQTDANQTVDKVVSDECDEIVNARHQESRAFLEEVGRRMEHQSTLLHAQCERITKFHLGVVTCVEQSAAKVEFVNLTVLDLLDELKDSNDESIGALELEYSQSCAKLRHSPNDSELQGSFHRSTELLANMETEYRRYDKRVRTAAEHNVKALDAQSAVYLHQLCGLFGLAPAAPPPSGIELDLDSFLSSKHIGELVDPRSKTEKSSESSESDTSKPIGEVDNREAGGGSNPPSARSEKGGVGSTPRVSEPLAPYHTAAGTELQSMLTAEALIERILNRDDEQVDTADEEVTTSNTTPREQAANGPSQPASARSNPPDGNDGGDLSGVDAENKKRAAIQLSIQAKLEQECLHLDIPSSHVATLVCAFRDAVLNKFEADERATSEAAIETRHQRAEASSLLLEERLRMHWPRKGRLDVQIYQPRMGELLNHRQRTERHLRALAKRIEAQQVAFTKKGGDATTHIEKVRATQVTFQAQLPLQTSLAALQGLESRAKKNLGALKSEGNERLDGLQAMVDSDVASLTNSSNEFVRACSAQLFPDLTGCDVLSGSDYHPEEVEAIQQALANVERQVRDQTTEREAQIAAIRDTLEHVLQMWPTFKTRYQACLQSLSMKEGLGQKFGLPRRTAQERIRSEMTRCEERSTGIDQLLTSLQSLCDSKETTPAETQVDTSTIQHQILVALIQLRAKVLHRGLYFGFLKNTSQLELCPLEFDPGRGGQVIRDVDIVDEWDRSRPSEGFLAFFESVSSRCREDTKLLFQQEGKLDELPPSGVPDALEEYLTEQQQKARAFVLQQEVKYHEQLQQLGDLLVLAPGVAIADLAKRTKARASAATTRQVREIDAEFERSMTVKHRHTSELRPQLSSPNNAEQLAALCSRERDRSLSAVSSLGKFRVECLTSQAEHAVAFEDELVAMSRCLMKLLDTIVMGLEDAKPTNGEELPKHHRKQLKRLRKLARVLESGDPKELKRPDKEIDALQKLGETPRFPRRTWGAIPTIGVHRLFEQTKQSILDAEALDTAVEDKEACSIASAACGRTESATITDASGEGLLTPAHRAMVKARDSAHAEYTAFCSTELGAAMATAHERIQDEQKWRTNWERGIANMMQRESSEQKQKESTE